MLSILLNPSSTTLNAELDAHIVAAVKAGKQALLLTPHFAWARQRKEELAATVPFGLSVLTLFQFIEQRWELEGDGRRLINQTARLVLARNLINKNNEAYSDKPQYLLPNSPRFVVELSTFLRTVVGEDALDTADKLETSLRERLLLQIALAYRDELASRNLVEQNEALSRLSLKDAGISVFVEGFSVFSPQQLCFFKQAAAHSDIFVAYEYDAKDFRYQGAAHSLEALTALTTQHKLIELDARADKASHVAEDSNKELIPLLTQGPHARDANIAKLLKTMMSKKGYDPKDCLVICKRLDGQKRSLLQACALEDIPVQASLSLSVGENAFGRAFLALRELVLGGGREAARRFIAEGFCGLKPDEAFMLDAQWCGTIEAEASQYREDLLSKAPIAANALDLAEQLFSKQDGIDAQTTQELCDALLALAPKRSGSLEARELSDAYAAAAAITRAANQAEAAGLSFSFDDLAALQYSKSYTNENAVNFVTSSRLPSRPYRLVLIVGLEAKNYPMDTDARPFDRLLEVLELCEPQRQEEDMRLLLARTQARAREVFVLERNLYDSEGREIRASALWDDMMEAYRKNGGEDKDDLPAELAAKQIKMNEGQLELVLPARSVQTRARRGRLRCAADSSSAAEPAQADIAALNSVRTDEAVSNSARAEAAALNSATPNSSATQPAQPHSAAPAVIHMMPRGQTADLARILEQTLVLSPTQIESYLCCPYKWFFEKKLGPRSFYEEFGPLQQGSFVHAVLEEFYRCFTGQDKAVPPQTSPALQGEQRVTPDNLELAYQVLEECLVRCEEQAEGFNPVDAAQKLDVERLYGNIRRFIALDADFLPGYMPQYFELHFGDKEQAPLEYAGEHIRGTIDRIDVKIDAQYAVLIDYKTGKLDKYALPSCKAALPTPGPYVQAHVYASAAAKLLGLRPVASLYRSVGTTSIAGAWDKDCLGAFGDALPKSGGLPYDKTPEGDPGSYQDYLDLTEEYVAAQMRRLRAGDIRPNPAHSGLCEYCLARPVCEKGGA